MDAFYTRLQEFSLRIADRFPQPAFYDAHQEAIRRSEAALQSHELVQHCRKFLDASLLECAHGLCHCESVARDAGAIVLAEGERLGMDGDAVEPLFVAAIVAGLLHDIKRRENDHAVKGSLEADRILSGTAMNEQHRGYVTYAIRNHEAFKATCDLDDPAGCIVSDALYDADKFRWGPENFTTTLWTIVSNNNTPARNLYDVFPEKMQGIERIKNTFRTATGRQYGPEIIDQGITIGNAVYKEMGLLLRTGP
ncbi:MAG: hypothetical protein M0042_09830 [Nitrospiraceae bacterium]|nr:hypothetical protein [Nitrospiraceae bacterium]